MEGSNWHFSADYREARGVFLKAAQNASARIESFIHPMRGPDGLELATDVAEFGPADAGKALFICSATHGVEGFSGSAIQTGLICEGWPDRLPTATKLVLIHAINPYGFAFLRRFDENNVDLNRNFIDPERAHPENHGYDALASWMAPKSISALSETGALIHLLLFAARHGMSATREAVTGGQYQYSTGLFFGGARRSWSASTLEKILKHYGKGVSKAVFLDVHTGLGPHGAAEIISNSPKDSEQFARTRAIWGGMVKTTKAEESVSADLNGTLKLAVIQALPDPEVTAAGIEFGTVPALVALRALRAENWLHHSEESETAQAKRIKGKLLAAFNPNSDSWRQMVWQKGSSAVGKALDWLDHQPLTSDLNDCKQESKVTTVN